MPNFAIGCLFCIDKEYSKYKNVEFIYQKDDYELFLAQMDIIIKASKGELTAKFTFKNSTLF